MFKFILKIAKKLIIGMILLFGYNVFLSSFNLVIPINIITILLSSFLDVPGIIGITLFYILNF